MMFLVLLHPIFPFTPPHTNSSKGTKQAGGRMVRYEGGSGGPPEKSYYEEFALGIGAIGFLQSSPLYPPKKSYFDELAFENGAIIFLQSSPPYPPKKSYYKEFVPGSVAI